MTKYNEYTQAIMRGNLNDLIQDFSEFELFVHRQDTSDEIMQLILYGQFGVSAPSKDALIALDAIESRHGVLPTHTLSITGGELHIYADPDDIDIIPFDGNELNWLSTNLSIHDASQSVELPACPRLLKIMPEWEESNPTQAFIDDVKAFNEGRLTITAQTEITCKEKQPSIRLGGDDPIPGFPAERKQQVLGSQATPA